MTVICPNCGTKQPCEQPVSPNSRIRCSACGEPFLPAGKAYTNQRNNQYKSNRIDGRKPKRLKALIFAFAILVCVASGFWSGYVFAEKNNPFACALRAAERFYTAIRSGSYKQFKSMLDIPETMEQDRSDRDVVAFWNELRHQDIFATSESYWSIPVSRTTIRKHEAFVCKITNFKSATIAIAVAKINGRWKVVGVSGKSM